jgi:membrane dipeptidase
LVEKFISPLVFREPFWLSHRHSCRRLSAALVFMFIFDAHLDLAMNALEWNRDLRELLPALRERDRHYCDKPDRGNATVSFPEMRRGRIGICVATQIARYVKPANRLPGWHSPEQAWAQTQGQLAWYRAMEECGELTSIRDRAQLEAQFALWNNPAKVGEKLPIGYILSLEGADSILSMRHLERAFENGLRALGPAHYGPGTYAQGTDATGGIGTKGRELLQEMQQLGIILDATHLCDDSFWEALDAYSGPIWASHHNCRALVPHNRQLSDEQIKTLVERGAVIGAVFDAWMMIPGWQRGKSTPESTGLTLSKIVDHIDHICQIAGNSKHCGIGSDLDGAYGTEQTPSDVKTIADLQRLQDLLAARGYKQPDVENILHGNFMRFLRTAWK